MKLDPIIENGKRPLTCFDAELAESYVGRQCYFSDVLSAFADLADKTNDSLIYKGILLKVWQDGSDPFETALHRFYTFCLPCDWITGAEEKKEKKYRPFADTKEFFIKTNFEAGDLIYIRSKTYNIEYHPMLTGWTDEELMLGNLQGMSFDELFQRFELWDGEDKFIPFGVEE